MNERASSNTNKTPSSRRDEPIVPQPERSNGSHSRRSFFWPILLIGFGIILLLSNMGVVPATSWAVLWRLWPIALIALGVDVLIGHRSVVGAIASGILALLLIGLAIGVALLADQIPALIELAKPAELVTRHVEHPLGEITQARVSVDWTSSPGFLSALSDSNNLIEADVAYRGELAFDVDIDENRADVSLDSYLQGISYGSLDFDDSGTQWEVQLHPTPQYDLYLDSGSGPCDYDLTGLRIREVELDSGSGHILIRFPSEGSIRGEFDTGSGDVEIIVPKALGVRIELDSGSGQFRPDETFAKASGDDESVWQTLDYDEAKNTLELEIDQGSGSIEIRSVGD